MAYSPLDYASMLGDQGRMGAYSAALKRAITPESVVLDLGTGMGYFAVLSCFLGAKHVYAVEPNSAISVGKQLARDNGVENKITWFEDYSKNVTLPEKVDIIVSDLRGLLPQNEGNISSVRDARSRFLKPKGILLPERDRLHVAIASDPEAYSDVKTPWHPVKIPNINLSAYERVIENSFISRESTDKTLLSPSLLWTEIDYRKDTTLNYRKVLDFTINRNGVGHGFFVWFEAVVDAKSRYSFGPGNTITVYGSSFFPWQQPIDLSQNDKIRLDLSVLFGPNGYDWTWNTQHQPHAGNSTDTKFQQSTFLDATAVRKEYIQKQSPQFTPTLKQRGQIALRTLSLMGENRSNQQIAQALGSEFATLKKTTKEWETIVGDLSLEFAD